MIRLARRSMTSIEDARAALQTAIQLEFGTLPPYLYSLYTIRPGTNAAAAERIKSVVMQEMVHFCLDCNILNAIGGTPRFVESVPTYPGPLPGDLGGLTVHLLPFSEAAMQQGMAIETPEDGPIEYPVLEAVDEQWQTIGEFYADLQTCLEGLPAKAWHADRHQITDAQFLVSELFPVGGLEDAKRAIHVIVTEGEGSSVSPLDLDGDLAHFYRFKEIADDKLLTRTPEPPGYAWMGSLGVDFDAVFPAIADPSLHDFSDDPAAAAAQHACNLAFSVMLDELELAVSGKPRHLGNAVRAMFDLRMAAIRALTTPLKGTSDVAGPAFIYLPRSER